MSRRENNFHLPLLLATIAFALGAVLAAGAPSALAAPPASPAGLPSSLHGPVTDPPEENSLPIGMTPEEEAMKDLIGTFTRDTQPPPGPGIRQCAEWEPVTGVLVRYAFGLPYNVLREMAEDIELWVLVGSQSEQTACYNALQSNGVNMAHVRFIMAGTNSIWTRDYGPQFAFDANGDQGIIDHHYNRPRPLDDQVNYIAGPAWSLPVYGSPLVTTGGNYMCDGHDNAFSTDLVWNENSLTHDQIAEVVRNYLGIETYHVVPDISTSGIHHIDCWAKLLDEETILVKQVATNHGSYQRIENNVALLRTFTNAYGRPYKIVRVYCAPAAGDVAAYTNSIILGKKVFVPLFNVSSDATALQTYQAAMPGYEVLGFTGSWLSDDAIHCRAMGIHDKYMLRVDVKPLPDTLTTNQNVRLDVLVDDRSEAGLKADSLLVYWRVAGQPGFSPLTLTASGAPDSFYVNIPGQPTGTRVEYYVFAADLSNRREARPIVAPAGTYSYYIGNTPAAVDDRPGQARANLALSGRNPFTDQAMVRFRLAEPGPARLVVTDVSGRLIATVLAKNLPAGEHSTRWDGRAEGGAPAPNGIYFFSLTAGGRTETVRGVLIH